MTSESPTETDGEGLSASLTYETLRQVPMLEITRATVRALKNVLEDAPLNSYTQPSSQSKSDLLASVLELRDKISQSTTHQPSDDEQNTQKLFNFSNEDIMRMSQDSRPTLVRLMQSALKCDPSLSPKDFNPTDSASVMGTVLSWKVCSVEKALQHQSNSYQLNSQDQRLQDRAALTRIFSLSQAEVDQMAENDKSSLLALITQSLRIDPELTPRTYDPNDGKDLALLVCRWQLNANQTALARREALQPHPHASYLPPATNTLRPSTVLGNAVPSHTYPSGNAPMPLSISKRPSNPLAPTMPDVLDTTPSERKKRKVSFYGGVPLRPQESIQPNSDNENLEKGFHSGLGERTLLPSHLARSYPGGYCEEPTLTTEKILGPTILHGITKSGVNIEEAVRRHRWNQDRFNQPYPSEEEALTLSRILHLHLQTYKTMEEAFYGNVWMETALRRLWALFEVEKLTGAPSHIGRDDARRAVAPLLEVHPASMGHLPAVENMLNRHIANASRAQNAIRSLNKQARHQNTRNHRRNGPNKQE